MAVFEIALAFVAANERGFVNNPVDRGGPTNMGITQRVLSAYLGRPATIEDVQGINNQVLSAIYRKNYWDMIKGDKLTQQRTATYLMDMAILMGPVQAAKLAQTAIGVVSDGIVGPKTIAALNAYDPTQFGVQFHGQCVKFFAALVTRDPEQLVFLKGWVNRVSDMIALKVT